MLDVEAAVGLAQLLRYESIIARRRANATWYDQNLNQREGWVLPPIVVGATYSHYVVRVLDRKLVLDEWATKGVHLGELIQYSIPLLTEYAKHGYSECPRSAEASIVTINLPLMERNVKKVTEKS